MAAARAFVTADGVDAVSMRKVAAEVGLAPTAIYWHVGSREDLLNAVLDEIIADLPPIRAGGTGARDRIAKRTYVRAVGYPSETFDAGMSEARKKEWRMMEIAGGHIVPLDEPMKLTEMLVQLA